jgi:hypothetical protein
MVPALLQVQKHAEWDLVAEVLELEPGNALAGSTKALEAFLLDAHDMWAYCAWVPKASQSGHAETSWRANLARSCKDPRALHICGKTYLDQMN